MSDETAITKCKEDSRQIPVRTLGERHRAEDVGPTAGGTWKPCPGSGGCDLKEGEM